MAGDVRESFLQLMEAQSAKEVVAACEADPRMLDPAFEEFLIGFEDAQRAEGQDVSLLTVWRLVLRSVREGRNLYASANEMLASGSARTIHDLVLSEPLLLEPVLDVLLRRMIRAARQQGVEELAEAMEAQRQLLARLRAHGAVDGYFNILVTQLVSADADRQAELVRENADLAEDFRRYVKEQGRVAANLGHHDHMQQLLYATSLMAGITSAPLEAVEAASADRAGRLIGLVMSENDPDAMREALLAAPEMHDRGSAFVVAGVLNGEIDRAALDRDVVRVRKLWVTRHLVLRSAETGVAGAREALERGELWPPPTERI
jgi:hypothetical protein